jgi:hypothetical protein
MSHGHARPEDRSRSGIDSLLEQPWADTHAGCFRSEGFAEDLPDAPPQAPAAGSRRPAWNLRRQGAALPLLGAALAGVRGAFGR